MKTLGNRTSFILVNRTIRQTFNTKDPLAIDNVMSLIWWNQLPSTISNKGNKLRRHGLTPFIILDSLSHTYGLYFLEKKSRELKVGDWLMNVVVVVGNNGRDLGGGGSGWFGERLKVRIGKKWIFSLFRV